MKSICYFGQLSYRDNWQKYRSKGYNVGCMKRDLEASVLLTFRFSSELFTHLKKNKAKEILKSHLITETTVHFITTIIILKKQSEILSQDK